MHDRHDDVRPPLPTDPDGPRLSAWFAVLSLVLIVGLVVLGGR